MKPKPTGGIRLETLIDSGKIPFRGGVWLDTYNQAVGILAAGTIKARIDSNCMYFVTQAEDV